MRDKLTALNELYHERIEKSSLSCTSTMNDIAFLPKPKPPSSTCNNNHDNDNNDDDDESRGKPAADGKSLSNSKVNVTATLLIDDGNSNIGALLDADANDTCDAQNGTGDPQGAASNDAGAPQSAASTVKSRDSTLEKSDDAETNSKREKRVVGEEEEEGDFTKPEKRLKRK